MTNPYPRAGPYSNFRRSSYASVAAGTASADRPSHSPPTRSGNLSHLLHQDRLDRQRDLERHALISNSIGSALSMGPSKAAGERLWARRGRSENAFNDDLPAQPPEFMCPSYLRNSRHVDRLHVKHQKEVAAIRERRQGQGRGVSHNGDNQTPSLSTSSSSANLHTKASSTHSNPPTQDTGDRIHQLNPDDALNKLPTCWSDTDKCQGLEISSEGLEVRFQGVTKTSDEAATVRSDHPMPKEVGIYYFEVTVLSRGKEGLIGIGFSSAKASLNRLPGWEPDSWAYHGDDGFSFACTASGKTYGPKFSAFDIIGCGVDFSQGSAFFTKNGVFLGDAFQNIRTDRPLYPSVGVKKPGEHLRVNFGHTPFVFDINGLMQNERAKVKAEINKTSVATLQPSLDERSLIQELIAQYFAHDGYVSSARAFAEEVHEQRKSLSDQNEPLKMFDPSQDTHAINRQRIRAAILDGDIDRALNYTTTHYPHLLEEEENRGIYFKLRCRKFIEMMRLCNEAQHNPSSPTHSKAFGKLPEKAQVQEVDVFNHQMELDEQIQRESRPPIVPPVSIPPPLDPTLSYSPSDYNQSTNDNMDTAPDLLKPRRSQSGTHSGVMNHTALLSEAIAYGSELQAEFGSDTRPVVSDALTQIFALVAYTDARESIVGGLMEAKGRVEIAEALNGAILVSLGKPSSAALEKLCAQAEVLVDMLGADGGPGAFVNVSKDCLQ
ncbi:hypothetical protein MBLNU459_g6685t1 [Dothideomycetes sp. NU459]